MRAFDLLQQSAIEQRAEAILAASLYMSPSCWLVERDLAQMKWFDYRFLSPVQATLHYVDEYQRVFRLKWRRHFDSTDAGKKRGIATGGLFHSRKEFSEFWNARVHADSMGVRYDVYISTAMETALRRAKQKRLLRAGQMRRADCIQAIEKRWEEELAGSRWLSELPHYRGENHCALPAQFAHQEHVAHGVRKRSNGALALGMAIDELRVLPVETAEAVHGAEFVARARERSMGIGRPAPVELLEPEQLIPSCFGLPAPFDVAAEPCNKCPLADQCRKASEHVLADVVEHYGSADPTLHHRRELGRERVRRHREKKRLTEAAASDPVAGAIAKAA
ncbi:hypothetical protein [Methylobacterium sp. Leaf118]|uniref:hypothetical protein n=1 Tax=Methylobacterium sp. Leaf118 TaxID=2876562 RepID=UPI001E372B41|nr:hypothetical protein [Methylobacterium sp. Leaf118]